MSQPKGLVYCIGDWSDTYCIAYSIEFAVSLVIFLILLHDFAIRVIKQRQFNFFFIVCLLMIIALVGTTFKKYFLANMIFVLDHFVLAFAYLQGYAYDLYFTAIVYQVSRRIIRIKQGSKYFKLIWYGTHGTLIFFILFLTVTFIVRDLLNSNPCNEVWFFVVNVFEILLSISMVIAGRWHNKLQQQKVQGMMQRNVKNPLPQVWKWIIINIVCQLSRFTRAFIYIVSPQNCNFSYNYIANEILGLIFDLFGFHVGMIATIIFFRQNSEQDSLSKGKFQSTVRDRICTGYSKQIQMQTTNNEPNENLVKVRQKEQYQEQRMTAKAFFDTRNEKKLTLLENKQVNFSI